MCALSFVYQYLILLILIFLVYLGYKTIFKDQCRDILEQCMTYKLIPDSGKVVVFDSALPVSHALDALLTNDINCGCVYNSTKRCYVGMLSATDFLDILIHSYEGVESKQEVGQQLSLQRISDWQDIKRGLGTSRPSLLSVTPESTLFDAVWVLSRHKVHRLAVVQVALPSTVLCVLSHHRILHFMLQNNLSCFDFTLRQLDFGQHQKEVVTATYETKLIDALQLLKNNKVSTLPILDENGVPMDAYSRSDVRLIALDRLYPRLDLTLREVLAPHVKNRTLQLCTLDDSIHTVVSRLIASSQHLLLCVSPERKLVGIVSLTDIFSLIAIRENEQDNMNDSDRDNLRTEEDALSRSMSQLSQLSQSDQPHLLHNHLAEMSRELDAALGSTPMDMPTFDHRGSGLSARGSEMDKFVYTPSARSGVVNTTAPPTNEFSGPFSMTEPSGLDNVAANVQSQGEHGQRLSMDMANLEIERKEKE